MTRPTPDPAPSAGHEQRHDESLEHQVLELVRNWMRRTRENASARTEASIDRGSFESFPASDPVASAAPAAGHVPALGEVDCTMRHRELIFRCAPSAPDPDRPPPAWTLEGDAGDGSRLRLRVWVEDETPEGGVPENLELEAVHASLRPRQQERRAGADRRESTRTMPAGFDRRRSERRASEGAQQDA